MKVSLPVARQHCDHSGSGIVQKHKYSAPLLAEGSTGSRKMEFRSLKNNPCSIVTFVQRLWVVRFSCGNGGTAKTRNKVAHFINERLLM